ISVKGFNLSYDIGMSMRSDNYTLLRVLFKAIRDKNFEDQVKFINLLIAKISPIDDETLLTKYNIYKKGLIEVLTSTLEGK
ncbi:MAG TPA: hypothetical protein PKC14_02175, partial [Candidatus Absconditabacterales bacterium]|nr:hypothetical protein [Candidatus Absconditabacterales bacterium]